MIRKIINGNVYLSHKVDSILPESYQIEGYSDFSNKVLEKYITKNSTIYDVGGGKQPHVANDLKKKLSLSVIGLDINENELRQAPKDSYDRAIAADITEYKGQGDADLVICKALLEHVQDTRKAIIALSTIINKKGKILIFVPSRNAIFARLNLIIPESLKKKILFSIFPQTTYAQGFKAYYDRCTPKTMRKIVKDCGLEVLEFKPYFKSGYFSFFFPFHLLWRIYVVCFRLLAGDNAAETFTMVIGKK